MTKTGKKDTKRRATKRGSKTVRKEGHDSYKHLLAVN